MTNQPENIAYVHISVCPRRSRVALNSSHYQQHSHNSRVGEVCHCDDVGVGEQMVDAVESSFQVVRQQ